MADPMADTRRFILAVSIFVILGLGLRLFANRMPNEWQVALYLNPRLFAFCMVIIDIATFFGILLAVIVLVNELQYRKEGKEE